jgi:hypothetical protein
MKEAEDLMEETRLSVDRINPLPPLEVKLLEWELDKP